MIAKHLDHICCEDLRLIENYDKAVNDPTQIWDCHHRLEELGLSADELKEQGKYFKVPANELIFLTHAEHAKLHHDVENCPMYGKRGKENPNYGSRRSEETKQKMKKSAKKRYEDPKERQKQSEAMKKRYEDPKERRKTGEAMKKRYEDPKERQKMSVSMIGKNKGKHRVYRDDGSYYMSF